MTRLKATICYDGAEFAGYQIQPDSRTVQKELLAVLKRIHKGTPVEVVSSGRTDAKVHATGQVIHFDTPYTIPMKNWLKALNVQLPPDIRVLDIQETTPDFHARYHAKGKVYRYIWDRSAIQSPFKRNYAVPLEQKVDLDRMKLAAQALVGTHDFTSFCAARSSVKDKVRTIYNVSFEEHGSELHLIVEGQGFLYNMVRIFAGTLVEVGVGRIAPEELPGIIAAKDRDAAGKTGAPQGLYLEKVDYED